MLKGTKRHKKYWEERDIDWKQAYFDTHDHPHRKKIVDIVSDFRPVSLLEVGCASGPNLYALTKAYPRLHLGGVDISKDAIEEAKKQFAGNSMVIFDDTSAEDLYFQDRAVDMILTDMTLIYLDPIAIRRALKEFKRVARRGIILVEFHSRNPLKRLALAIFSGYWSYNYKRLLSSLGFYDIQLEKINPADWEGGEPQKTFGYYITARI